MTDTEYETLYYAGRQAFRSDYGQHGPTLYPSVSKRTLNPHQGVRATVWELGYQQDVRRLPVTACMSVLDSL